MTNTSLQALKMLKEYQGQAAKAGNFAKYKALTQWMNEIKRGERIAVEDAAIVLHMYNQSKAGV